MISRSYLVMNRKQKKTKKSPQLLVKDCPGLKKLLLRMGSLKRVATRQMMRDFFPCGCYKKPLSQGRTIRNSTVKIEVEGNCGKGYPNSHCCACKSMREATQYPDKGSWVYGPGSGSGFYLCIKHLREVDLLW